MNQYFSKYAGVLLLFAISVGSIASAAIISLPNFQTAPLSPTETPMQKMQISSESDFYTNLIESINILDARTNGTQNFDAGGKTVSNLSAPIQSSDAATKEYVDTQIAHQSAWEYVSLKTSENFDPACDYLIKTTKNAFRATHVQTNELKYVEPWGAGEYQAAWVSPLKKTVLHNDIAHYYNDVVNTEDEKIVSLQKRCW